MRWPSPLGGNGVLHRWLNDFLAASKANTLLETHHIKPSRTPDGTGLQVNFPPVPNPKRFHPFKIYNAPHPTDSTKNSLTFQVRGGYVSYRSLYQIVNTPYGGNEEFNGVFEQIFVINTNGGDGTVIDPDTVNNNTRDWTTTRTKPGAWTNPEVVNVGNVGDFTVSDENNAGVFVLNSEVEPLSGILASFWLEFTDDDPDAFPVPLIKCRMYARGPGPFVTGRTSTIFPNPSPRVIPIGVVECRVGDPGVAGSAHPTDLAVKDQYVDDHVLQRYGPGLEDSDSLGPILACRAPMFFRGQWDDAEGGSAGKVYYPGDVIANFVTTAEGSVTIAGVPHAVALPDSYAAYVCQAVQIVNVAPNGGGGWLQMAGFEGF